MGWIQIAITLLCCFLTQTNADCDKDIDLTFVIDGSGSIYAAGAGIIYRIKWFVKKVIAGFNVGYDKTHVGAVIYSSYVRKVFGLEDFFNREYINQAIDDIMYPSGGTYTGMALTFTRRQIYNQLQDRKDKPNVCIVITDGKAADDVLGPAIALRGIGTTIIAIGIGYNYDVVGLKIMAGSARYVLTADFSKLDDITEPTIQKACEDNPSIQLPGKTSYPFTGKKYVINCVAFGWPLPTVKWLINGTELNDGDMNQTIHLESKSVREYFNLTLSISDLDLGHTGNYSCEATSQRGTIKRTILVTVSCPPILPLLTALNPVMGPNANVTLKCEVSRLDPKQLSSYHWRWMFKDRSEIKKDVDGNYETFTAYSTPNSCQQTKGSVTLHIANVTKQNLGKYKCVLMESDTVVAEKDIPFYAFVSSKVPSRPELNLTTVNCGRAIHVQWKSFSPSEITGYEIKLISPKEGLLQVFNLSSEVNSKQLSVQSNTVYEVHIKAKNSAGFSLWEKQQLTTTADVPELLNIAVRPSGCYAALAWSTTSDNSCPITRYTVYFREPITSSNENKIWNKESIRLLNNTYRLKLNCSKSYEVLVIAWNERGSSSADEKSDNVHTEKGVPFRPQMKVQENQCGEFEVIWSPPSLDSGGGPLTDFQVQIRQMSNDWRGNCTTFLTNSSCSIKGLQSETEYQLQVRAFNQKGPSDWASKISKTGFIGPPDPPQITNQSKVSGSNVTVLWTRPSQRNCNITMYSLHYRAIKPTTENWAEINITDASITNYTLYLHYSKKYEVIVFSWNALGRSEKSEAWEIGTAQYVPYQPIMHSDFIGGCSSINITWSPPAREALGGPVTGYLAQIRSATSDETWMNYTEFNNPQLTSCMFTHMKTKSKYDVKVLAKNGIGYGWPSEILRASTSQADRPDKPEITDINEQVCNVTIEWSKPSSNGCPILFYTIRYKEQKAHQGANDWEEINVTDLSTNQREFKLKCSTTYEFQVVASNEIGKSLPSTVRSATTEGDTTQPAPYEGLSLASILKIVFTIAGLALAAILLFIAVRYCKKRNKHPEKWTAKDIQVLDHCEIPPIRTEFIEFLGQGAFGKVHKAKLKDGLEYFAIEQNWVNALKRRQKIVAVKELHDNANEEEKREFMDEINLMKEVGKHMNVLSFLGCWTTTKPLNLIIEYIAHGDLLHWLRRKRRQITGSTLGAAVAVPKDRELYAGARTQITAADQDGKEGGTKADIMEERPGPSTVPDVTEQGQENGDGSNECKIPMIVFTAPDQEESIPPEGEATDDECDYDCESFDPSDLMSFARQIARGMSYLSEKGLVHRDLAARNILVGHGKNLKIADFGLMREVYHEIYEVKTQKKLPIKWMAPESIYEQMFTFKSDVWSCGVVMWEIATLGGAPYPLLSNTEIMSLLRTEYRMAKPDLCPDNFYALMTECWKRNPHERPSFQELAERLEQLMLQEVEYFDFNLVDETKDYYQVQESKTREVSCETKFGW